MAEVHETDLPGVGTRFDFTAASGEPLAVVVHRSGRREILAYDRNDPDRCHTVLRLSEDDTRTLVELLGASRVTMSLGKMQQELEGLTIDWLTVEAGSQWVGHTLAEAAVHTRTGVSIVAILRDGESLPAPSADVTLQHNDRLVAVGRPDGVTELARELSGDVARMIVAATSNDVALVFIELGAIICGLAIIARIADRLGVSPIPLYLVAGLFFGEGGLVKLDLSADFIELGAEIGVILLLLTLGLEYTALELQTVLRTGTRNGVLDLVLNAVPGALAAQLLGFGAKETLLLAGITYISSSGIIAKLLNDLDRLGNRETPTILSILVMEDLAMAAYLPIAGAVLVGAGLGRAALAVVVSLAVVAGVLFVVLRFGHHVNRALSARSDEALLLGVLGVTLLVAGLAQRLQVSAAVGAFLVGIALSGVVQERATALIVPLRDLFAAVFFLFFGLQIDPGELWSSLVPAVILAVVTAATKIVTGILATRRAGIGPRGQMRAGTMLTVRGEFSIVIVGLGTAAALDPKLGGLAAAYVLILAAVGPILTRFADRLART